MTTTDDTALTDQLAATLDENFNPDRYPIMAAMFRDYAAAVLPIIRERERAARAEALREAAHYFARSRARESGLMYPEDLDWYADEIERMTDV